MKKLLLASVLAIASFPGYAAEPFKEDDSGEGMACYSDGSGCRPCKSDRECAEGLGERPKPATYRFRPRQEIWQCNDIRVTWTEPEPGVINYDIGGTIWGGINFTYTPRGLFLRGVPCVPLR